MIRTRLATIIKTKISQKKSKKYLSILSGNKTFLPLDKIEKENFSQPLF